MDARKYVNILFLVIACVPLTSILVMYGIIFVVKRFLVEVDPEDLEKIRYEWKGA
jgi:hypothetical protein